MKKNYNISGFTFIKNGLDLGYPILESIKSIEPLCDEVIINVGHDDPSTMKDDGTYEYLRDNLPEKKFIFLRSHWDPTLTQNGLILSQQTNIALRKCQGKYCQYIQGDEVLHENDLNKIEDKIKVLDSRPDIEGLIFNYIHFYGRPSIIKQTRNIYRREVRLIRNSSEIISWLDAQGFRHKDHSKLKCISTDANIYHYGWARKTAVMQKKVKAMDRLYHGNDFTQKNEFNYQKIWGLYPFKGRHPQIMDNWVKAHDNKVDILSLSTKFEWKNIGLMLSDFIEKRTGYRMGEYKNFILID